ncbi:hypothetical protein EDB86DRAFT_3121641 [Lactarius hatsudake]|nr:hypothetical protein EDB86DRAFT_3121641 [Lactarius hatsudake]
MTPMWCHEPQRLYSTLNTSSAQPLSLPHCLFFPAVSTFTDHLGPVDENIPRHCSNIGVAPETFKAAYPSLAGLLCAGDFDDFVGIRLPRDVPAWALIFAVLEAAEDWFDPVWHTLTWYFGAPEEDTATGRHTVTYLARQDGLEGKRLHAADHAALLDVLTGLARTGVAWMRRRAGWNACARCSDFPALAFRPEASQSHTSEARPSPSHEVAQSGLWPRLWICFDLVGPCKFADMDVPVTHHWRRRVYLVDSVSLLSRPSHLSPIDMIPLFPLLVHLVSNSTPPVSPTSSQSLWPCLSPMCISNNIVPSIN